MPRKIRVFISLGSNIDPRRHLVNACEDLSSILGDAEISPVYRSPAVGMNGNDFLNAVLSGTTTESVGHFAQTLRALETRAGRIRTANKFNDRTLDLDLLLYGDHICTPDTDNKIAITLPHPEIMTEGYVLQPLADIAGSLVHPTANISICKLLERLKQESPERLLSLQQIDPLQ